VLSLGDAPARNVGPDLLAPETVVHDVVARLRRADQSRLVGEALVDQRLVSGIGNMWLSELLWHTRVSPWSPLRGVSDEALAAALDWARDAMTASVEGRRPARAVYRRTGRGCPRCGDVIVSRGLGDANRTAYWCPTCQPAT
jgi:endonuclease-8